MDCGTRKRGGREEEEGEGMSSLRCGGEVEESRDGKERRIEGMEKIR